MSTSTSRPQTAFELYLQQKKVPQEDVGIPVAPPTPQIAPQPPSQVYVSHTPSMVKSRALRPSVSQCSSTITAVPFKPPAADKPSHSRNLMGAAPVVQPIQGITSTSMSVPSKPARLNTANTSRSMDENYQSLIAAASNLAAAAKNLSSTPADPSISKSYETLAKAATNLAESVKLSSTPKTNSIVMDRPSSMAARRLHSAQPPPFQSPPVPPLNLPQAGPPPPATPLYEAGTGLLRPMNSASHQGRSRSTPVGSRGKVSTPKFPAYNPLIHLRQSELAPPGTAGGLRPSTSNPITHELDHRPSTSFSPLASRGSSRASMSRMTPGGAGRSNSMGHQQSQAPGQADVLVLDKTETPLFIKYPGRVRMGEWPPPRTAERVSERDILVDDAAQRYNQALNYLKDKIYSRGPQALMTVFSSVDRDHCGCIDKEQFRRALKGLELQAVFDDVIIDMLTDAVDADTNGKIDYNEFVDAVRFNKLPYKAYDPRLKHRIQGDLDQPFGPPRAERPYGVMSDAEDNLRDVDARFESMYHDLHTAFRSFDSNQDGYISFKEFKDALQQMNNRHGLLLSDDDIKDTFMQADWDYSQGISYEEFLRSFSDNSGRRFMPEFMKPKTMRCSTIGAPWEWRSPRGTGRA